MTVWVVVVAYNPGLAGRRKQVQHTVLERNPEEAVAPIEVAHRVAVEVAQAVHMAVEVVVPIVVHKGIEVAHKEIEAAAPNLAAEVGLDHKTSIIPSWMLPWND